MTNDTSLTELRAQRDALPEGEERERLSDHIHDLEEEAREAQDETCAVYPPAGTYHLSSPLTGEMRTLTDRDFEER